MREVNGLEYLVDDFFIKHIEAESEYINLLTTIYGVTISAHKRDDLELHIKIAKSLELLIVSFLVTDDFLDKSDYRNHITTFYKKYGSEQTVLIAEILKSTATISFCDSLKLLKLSVEDKFKCIILFEDLYRTVCAGQLEEIKWLSNISDSWKDKEEIYWQIIYKTTASFFHFLMVFGAIVAELPDRKSLAEYGRYIGLAYQVRDDLIDVIGSPRDTGKQKGNDIREKKIRLPIIYLMLNGTIAEQKVVKEIYKKNIVTTPDVNKVINVLGNSTSIKMTKSKINELCDKAVFQISSLKNEELKEQLKDICQLIKID